jgi:KDO2-lipid IV(A) lauroyltransferase
VLNKVLFYIIVNPLSKLPLGILYPTFYFFYLNIYYIFGYRKKVVLQNINNSFPNKTEKEKKLIAKQFYIYLSQLFAESIKNLSITKDQLLQRITVKNPEIMDQLYTQNKSVILLSSHCNNWEFLITAQNLLFKHQAVGIGMPMTNKFWDKKINEKRERFGMIVVSAKNYKQKLTELTHTPTATLVLGDQNPSNPNNSYWTKFLNQTSAFFFGAEIMANQMDSAVVYASIIHLSKGHYEIELNLVTDKPNQEDYGFITQTYVNRLEDNINSAPPYWLWSHKRWKMPIPKNLEEIKTAHKQRFNEKFRSKIC